jgi:hypothetical protein
MRKLAVCIMPLAVVSVLIGEGLGRDFYSVWGGSSQRLPNVNTLITQSAVGYAFEVTPEGDVVWEFASPVVDEEGRRANVWRMTRYSPGHLRFLERVTE